MRIPKSGVGATHAAKPAEPAELANKRTAEVDKSKSKPADSAAIVSMRTTQVNEAVGKSQVDVAKKIAELRRMLAADSYHIDLRSLAESIVDDEISRAALGQ